MLSTALMRGNFASCEHAETVIKLFWELHLALWLSSGSCNMIPFPSSFTNLRILIFLLKSFTSILQELDIHRSRLFDLYAYIKAHQRSMIQIRDKTTDFLLENYRRRKCNESEITITNRVTTNTTTI